MQTTTTTDQPTSTAVPTAESEAGYLSTADIDLAGWVAIAAARHPELEEPIDPLRWPAAARAQLVELISTYRGMETVGELPRAEELRTAAAIHELVEANGYGSEYADALILDDDGEWQDRHVKGEVH